MDDKSERKERKITEGNKGDTKTTQREESQAGNNAKRLNDISTLIFRFTAFVYILRKKYSNLYTLVSASSFLFFEMKKYF
jgi:hypothetical protein